MRYVMLTTGLKIVFLDTYIQDLFRLEFEDRIQYDPPFQVITTKQNIHTQNYLLYNPSDTSFILKFIKTNKSKELTVKNVYCKIFILLIVYVKVSN